eukprot:388250_1
MDNKHITYSEPSKPTISSHKLIETIIIGYIRGFYSINISQDIINLCLLFYYCEQVFVIGDNDCGQLGFDHTNKITELTEWNQNISIKSINIGFGFTIITDTNDKIWCVGTNEYGQLGMCHSNKCPQLTQNQYFDKRNISIKTVMTNPLCNCTFFITNNDRVYVCGGNEWNKLGFANNAIYANITEPTLIDSVANIKDAKGGYFHTILLDQTG